MYKDEEELPLYHVEDSDKEINYYPTKTKYKSKKSSKIRFYKKTKYQFNNDDEFDYDNKNIKSLKKLYQENRYLSSIKKFLNILFNCNNLKVVYLFFILITVEFIEYFIDTFIDFFPIKFSMSILFIIPYIVITLDNEIFFQLNSSFELYFLIHLKLLVLFNKYMTFKEIIVVTICSTMFEIIFIKKIHVNQYYVSLDGIISKVDYKIYVFESEIFLLLLGFFSNFFVLFFLLKNNKLYFHLFDDIFDSCGYNSQVIYFFLLQYLFSRKFIKYIFKYIFIYSENHKRKEKIFLINIIFIICIIFEIILLFNLFKCFFIQKILYISIIGLIIFLYENVGFLVYISMILMSMIIYGTNYFIEKQFEKDIIILIKNNLIYINISFFLTLIFIVTIFLLEKKQITNFYIQIYQRIFIIKIIFDIWLIIKYIYSIYKYNPLNYLDIFLKTYKFFFISFLLNHCIILISVLVKIYIHVNPEDVEYYFEDIINFLNNKKENGEVFYGGNAPYVEIRLYKIFSNLFSFLKDDISKSNKKTKSFQKILYSVILCIFIFLCFVINNFLIYFPIFFILLQFFSEFLNDITFLILNKISSFVYIVIEKAKTKTIGEKFNKYKEDYLMQKYNKKIKMNKMTIYIKKEKLKLIYLLSFFYINIFWKKIFSYLFIIFYEKIISYWQYKIFGKLEPLGNIFYQCVIMNYYSEEKNLFDKENFVLILFLVPSSICIIYSHYYEKKIEFFFQNFILTSLFPLFFNMDILLVLLGFFNIFLMINIFAADEETYKHFKFWFFLFGIQSMNVYY